MRLLIFSCSCGARARGVQIFETPTQRRLTWVWHALTFRRSSHYVLCIVGSPEKGLLGIGQGKSPTMSKAADQAQSNGSSFPTPSPSPRTLDSDPRASRSSDEEYGQGLPVPEPDGLGRWKGHVHQVWRSPPAAPSSTTRFVPPPPSFVIHLLFLYRVLPERRSDVRSSLPGPRFRTALLAGAAQDLHDVRHYGRLCKALRVAQCHAGRQGGRSPPPRRCTSLPSRPPLPCFSILRPLILTFFLVRSSFDSQGKPAGFGDGLGGSGRKVDKGRGMRDMREVEVDRGRYGVLQKGIY